MKKLFLVPTLILSFVLIGCNNNKSEFKEYTFKEQLNDDEKQILVSKVKLEASKISGFKTTHVQETHLSHYETSETVDVKYTFYDNFHVHAQTKTKKSSSIFGITVKEDYSSVEDRFDYDDNNAVITYTDSEKDGVTFVVSPYAASERESANSTAYSSKYSGIISTVTPYNAYKDGKNFVFANSTINESITAVEWGSSTKEYRTLSRTQTICNINSNYRITSGYILSEQYANRDPETGEWFKKNTLLYLTKQTFSVSYGTMESGEPVRAPIKELFKNGYITSASGTLEFQSPSSNPINLTCSIKYDNPYQAHLIAKYKPETNFYSSYVVGNIVFKPNISVTYVNSIGGNSQSELLLSPTYELGEGVTTKNIDGVTYLATNISFTETLIVDLYVGIQQSDDALQSGIGFSKVAVYKV